MKEFDLQSIWNDADHQATEWYEHLRPELITKARKQNNGVLHKLKHFAMVELIFGIVFTIVITIYTYQYSFWLMSGAFLSLSALTYISYRQYWLFKKQVALVPTQDIITSTTNYLNLITDYRNRMTRLAILIAPFAVALGMYLGYILNGKNNFYTLFETNILVILIPALIVLSVLTTFTSKWYYNFFIGSKEKELQSVLDSLTVEE